MSAHVSGPLMQRCQRRLSRIGGVPDQVPSFAVSSCPWVATPDTVGGAVLAGPAGGWGTTSVAAVSRAADPAELDAVTVTRSRFVASSAVTVYADAVASAMSVQVFSAVVVQRRHW